jgi:glycosyltransferase involved in cell wall biosynthesis
MKILLSAYSCKPDAGSEPGIGWNWAQCIADLGYYVTIVTRAVNRADIEQRLKERPNERIRILYCDLPKTIQQIYKLPLGNYTYYVLWQRAAAQLAQKVHQQEPFDLVQHITWGSFRVPSFMGSLGIPFIFGPVGGGEDTPVGFRAGLGWQGRCWDALRRVSGTMMGFWMGSTYAAASKVVVTTPETLEKLPARFRSKATVCQAVGMDLASLTSQEPNPKFDRQCERASRIELLFVGRLLAWKGVHLILNALAQVSASADQIRLTVIGSGKDLSRLKKLAEKFGVTDKVHWIPWMDRLQLIRTYPTYDLFVFTSLHDSGGVAVLEALAYGLPVVCLDLGGPGVMVDNCCGRVIETNGRIQGQVVAELARVLQEYVDNRERLQKLSDGALKRIRTLTWHANVANVYGEIGSNIS